MGSGFALFGSLEAGGAAGLGFAVERLGHGRRAADLTELQHLDFEKACFCFDLKQIGDADLAGRLGGLPVRGDAAEVTRPGRERSGFEEARGPKPFIDAQGARLRP